MVEEMDSKSRNDMAVEDPDIARHCVLDSTEALERGCHGAAARSFLRPEAEIALLLWTQA